MTEPNIIFRGACIRLGPGGPLIHANDTHANVGITGISITSAGDLQITAGDIPVGSKVLHAAADVDESLASLNIFAGVSGGLGSSVVKLYQGTTRIRPDSTKFDIDTHNIWFKLTIVIP